MTRADAVFRDEVHAAGGWARGNPIHERVAAACRFVGARRDVRDVHIVTGQRPTFADLCDYQGYAHASRVRLSVDGIGNDLGAADRARGRSLISGGIVAGLRGIARLVFSPHAALSQKERTVLSPIVDGRWHASRQEGAASSAAPALAPVARRTERVQQRT